MGNSTPYDMTHIKGTGEECTQLPGTALVRNGMLAPAHAVPVEGDLLAIVPGYRVRDTATFGMSALECVSRGTAVLPSIDRAGDDGGYCMTVDGERQRLRKVPMQTIRLCAVLKQKPVTGKEDFDVADSMANIESGYDYTLGSVPDPWSESSFIDQWEVHIPAWYRVHAGLRKVNSKAGWRNSYPDSRLTMNGVVLGTRVLRGPDLFEITRPDGATERYPMILRSGSMLEAIETGVPNIPDDDGGRHPAKFLPMRVAVVEKKNNTVLLVRNRHHHWMLPTASPVWISEDDPALRDIAMSTARLFTDDCDVMFGAEVDKVVTNGEYDGEHLVARVTLPGDVSFKYDLQDDPYTIPVAAFEHYRSRELDTRLSGECHWFRMADLHAGLPGFEAHVEDDLNALRDAEDGRE